MPRPIRIQYENAFYHVMNHGRGRQKIFHNAEYFEDFCTTLEESHTRFDAIVHAYCLMGNHYHLLIQTPRANLDRIMRHVNGVYTQRYNRRKGTDGTLFKGRYKAVLIDENAYLLQVGRYIHRNPAEMKGASDTMLENYRWSSYLPYVNKAPVPEWLCRDKTYQMLGHRHRYSAYRNFVSQGNDARTEQMYGRGNLASVFGDSAFRQSLQEDKNKLRVSGDLASELSERPEIDVIVEAVATVLKTDVDKIVCRQQGRPRLNVARQLAMYCSQQLGDHSLKEIARYFSLSSAGSVSSAIWAINQKLDSGELCREYRRVEMRLYKMK